MLLICLSFIASWASLVVYLFTVATRVKFHQERGGKGLNASDKRNGVGSADLPATNAVLDVAADTVGRPRQSVLATVSEDAVSGDAFSVPNPLRSTPPVRTTARPSTPVLPSMF